MARYIGELFKRLIGSIMGYFSKPSAYIRELSFSEQNMELICREGVMTVTRMVFIESKKPIDETMVTAILEQVIQKIPALRLKIEQNKGKLYWKEMDQVIPNLKVDISGDWVSCFKENTRMLFDTANGPLWRFTFITNVDTDYMDKTRFNYQYGLMFGFHHAILDAKSSLVILHEIQLLLNIVLKGGSLHDGCKVPVTELAKPLDFYKPVELSLKEKLLIFGMSVPVLSFLLHNIIKFAILRVVRQENEFLKHVGLPAETEECTCVKQIPFSKEETKELLFACKSHGVTVQSTLQTASAMALYNLIKNPIIAHNVDSLSPSLTVHIGCTVNMKNIVPEIPRDALGCFISLLPTKLEIDNSSKFWKLAAESRRQIHDCQLSGATGFLKMIYMIRKLQINHVKELSGPPYYGRSSGLHVSYTNLGNCSFLNLDPSVEARINGHTSASSEHTVGPLFAHSALTILNRLNWSIVYFPNITSEKVVEYYVAETKRILNKALADSL